ncbi:MAG TPA: PilT/PilU family type 4a pilus ATPase, partial [Opitutales bacterium]|nr:PilT/PilU family type 4a pilus ATPase [Opitutales bacterium]
MKKDSPKPTPKNISPLSSLPPLLDRFLKIKSTDMHVTSNDAPFVRVNGDLIPMPDEKVVTLEEATLMARALLGEQRFARFLDEHEYDFAETLPSGARIRINASFQRGNISLAIRLLPSTFPEFETLGLPRKIVSQVFTLRHGLVLVTGATGSGKTTTLGCIINELNMTRPAHIVTIEEPVEYLHKSKCSYVTQREVGVDTESFSEALRRSFRQDPDIVLIGEMRDPETIRAALTLSETGHLTFGTLHTSEAFQTVIRMIGSFPPAEQERARLVVATTLRVVICQQLLPRADGSGRVLATETMVATPVVRALIPKHLRALPMLPP